MIVLAPTREFGACVSYQVQKHTELNDMDLTKVLIVPEDKDLTEYLQENYANRFTNDGNRVRIYNDYYIPSAGSLAELMLAVKAHGRVLASGIGDVREELETDGFGDWNESAQTQVFCNGLVFERVPNDSVMRVTMDPRRAKRIMTNRMNRKSTPAKPRPPRLKLGDMIDYGRTLRDFIWEKLDLKLIKCSCLAGSFWETFRSSSWDEAVYSLDCLHQFVRHNKIKIFTAKLRKEIYRPVTILLLTQHLRKLRKIAIAPKKDEYDRFPESQRRMRKVLAEVRRNMIRFKGVRQCAK